MKLSLFCSLWGVEEDWATFFPRVRAAGYEGIETILPPQDQDSRFRRVIEENGLQYIAAVVTHGSNVEEHLESLEAAAGKAERLGPLLINSHSGVDAWTETDVDRFFEEALEIERRVRIPIAHETHRQRALYSPWSTTRVLKRFPELKVTCDFSHWVCVCERLLSDQLPAIQMAADHAVHIHARVGYEEGPQVPDPRAPEYSEHVAAHEQWWSMVWRSQAGRGLAVSTLTPEYGPGPYLHALPFTRMPVTDLWQIRNWQGDRERERFQEFSAAGVFRRQASGETG